MQPRTFEGNSATSKNKRFKSVQLSPIKRLAPKTYASKARDHNFLSQSAGHAMEVPHPGRAWGRVIGYVTGEQPAQGNTINRSPYLFSWYVPS
jgi:hypothetical protein